MMQNERYARVLADRASYFTATYFAEVLGSFGIELRYVPAGAHWGNTAEKGVDLLRTELARVEEKPRLTTQQIFALATASLNGREVSSWGRSRQEVHTGRPRRAYSLIEDALRETDLPSGGPGQPSAKALDAYFRNAKRLTKESQQKQNRARLNAAARHKPLPEPVQLMPGDTFIFMRTDAINPGWRGPAVCLGTDGTVVAGLLGGRVITVHVTRARLMERAEFRLLEPSRLHLPPNRDRSLEEPWSADDVEASEAVGAEDTSVAEDRFASDDLTDNPEPTAPRKDTEESQQRTPAYSMATGQTFSVGGSMPSAFAPPSLSGRLPSTTSALPQKRQDSASNVIPMSVTSTPAIEPRGQTAANPQPEHEVVRSPVAPPRSRVVTDSSTPVNEDAGSDGSPVRAAQDVGAVDLNTGEAVTGVGPIPEPTVSVTNESASAANASLHDPRQDTYVEPMEEDPAVESDPHAGEYLVVPHSSSGHESTASWHSLPPTTSDVQETGVLVGETDGGQIEPEPDRSPEQSPQPATIVGSENFGSSGIASEPQLDTPMGDITPTPPIATLMAPPDVASVLEVAHPDSGVPTGTSRSPQVGSSSAAQVLNHSVSSVIEVPSWGVNASGSEPYTSPTASMYNIFETLAREGASPMEPPDTNRATPIPQNDDDMTPVPSTEETMAHEPATGMALEEGARVPSRAAIATEMSIPDAVHALATLESAAGSSIQENASALEISAGAMAPAMPEGAHVLTTPEGVNALATPEGANVVQTSEDVDGQANSEGTPVLPNPEVADTAATPESPNSQQSTGGVPASGAHLAPALESPGLALNSEVGNTDLPQPGNNATDNLSGGINEIETTAGTPEQDLQEEESTSTEAPPEELDQDVLDTPSTAPAQSQAALNPLTDGDHDELETNIAQQAGEASAATTDATSTPLNPPDNSNDDGEETTPDHGDNGSDHPSSSEKPTPGPSARCKRARSEPIATSTNPEIASPNARPRKTIHVRRGDDAESEALRTYLAYHDADQNQAEFPNGVATIEAKEAGCVYGRVYLVQQHNKRSFVLTEKEARAIPELEEAIKKEIQAFREHDCVKDTHIDDVPRRANVISTRWVFTMKYPAEGGRKIKARLVARGFQDREKRNVSTNAPTAAGAVQRLVLTILAQKQWIPQSWDFATAFLQGSPITREIYIAPPVEAVTPGIVWRLRKPVYGLVSAPNSWYHRLKKVAEEAGFSTDVSATGLLTLKDKSGVQGILALHVDDAIGGGTAKFQAAMEQIGRTLKIGNHEIADFTYMGLQVHTERHEQDFDITLDGNSYIQDMQEMTLDKRENHEVLTSTEMEGYGHVVGCIGYVASAFRPDIAYDASRLGRFVAKATVRDGKRANAVVEYLKAHPIKNRYRPGTTALTIFHDGSGPDPDGSQGGRIAIFSDHNSEHITGLVHWESKKVKRVCRSTATSEVLSAHDAYDTGAWIRELWKEVTGEALPVHLITDSHGLLLKLCKTSLPMEKRLSIDLCALRQGLLRKEFDMTWIPSAANLSDCLTKGSKSGDDPIRVSVTMKANLLKALSTGLTELHDYRTQREPKSQEDVTNY